MWGFGRAFGVRFFGWPAAPAGISPGPSVGAGGPAPSARSFPTGLTVVRLFGREPTAPREHFGVPPAVSPVDRCGRCGRCGRQSFVGGLQGLCGGPSAVRVLPVGVGRTRASLSGLTAARVPGGLSIWADLGVGARILLIVCDGLALGSDPGCALITNAGLDVGDCTRAVLVVRLGLGLDCRTRAVLAVRSGLGADCCAGAVLIVRSGLGLDCCVGAVLVD